MDEQRLQDYLNLIQELLSCPSGSEAAILSRRPELLDRGLVEVMRAEAEMRAARGERNAGWLRDFAGKIEAVNYSLPGLQKQAEADRLWNQAAQHYRHSEFPQAFQCLQQCLQLYQEIGDGRGIAKSWGGLGYIELNRGNWDEAERLYRQCLEIETELGDRSGMAKCWGLLGDIERNRGNWDEAERLFRQYLEIETELGDRSGMATSWGLLGDIERKRGNWDEAERLYRQSLQLSTELGDRSHMAYCWGWLGYIQRKRGNWDEMERRYQQSLQLSTELGDRSGMVSSWTHLGILYQHLYQIPEALAAWRSGLELCPPAKFPVEALDLGRRLGNIAFDIRDWETAIYGYEVATEAVETLCSFTNSYLEKQNRREAVVEIYEKLVQACINAKDIGKALASVERSKSRNLIELLSNRELSPSGDVPPELRQELDRLRREVTAKQRLLESLDTATDTDVGGEPGLGQRGAGSSSYKPEAVAALRQNYEQAQQALTELLDTLKTYDPNFTLTQRVEPIQFSQIRELLDEETVLIEWYLTRERIYTFIVLGGDPPQPPLEKGGLRDSELLLGGGDPPQPPLDKGGLRDSEPPFLRGAGGISVHTSTPEQYQQLQELRQTYLQSYAEDFSDWDNHLDRFLPLLRDILQLPQLLAPLPRNLHRLILVPYRDLHLFPLHAIPLGDGDEPEYLADRFSQGVSYAPSCQFLQVSRRNRKPTPKKRLFAIQNPTEDLTYADLEVEAILDNFSATSSHLARQQAQKTALNQDPHRQDFRAAEYLHFAGHGAFNFITPLLSPLVLAGAKIRVSDTEPTPDTAKTRYLPWRKGTAIDLTKCYTLGELFELSLPACRLVILSACETGLTDFSSQLEEYISLGLGFLYAGAANVVCSLWAVNDVSTAILMVKFYEEIENQPSVSQALKAAQKWMREVTKQQLIDWLENSDSQAKQNLSNNLNLGLDAPQSRPYEHPIHWAAFCAIGF
ncbi:CHAT domain-containing tetratricopeptide repeat protein [Lyngbya sp. CCY1209]|uniref:CHAT domain-containing protein n=1 Tax=Lyngbya sp. CCY1209 TaxID=2886103 RepID=UPI002D2006EB|nr:CHAT domain-containing tetratricopeptide repeat protein [Lyngbya sp. CCY1209]MEB3887078.1 CHAT domain-containing protein [Lyngbya sp. CCY1209]